MNANAFRKPVIPQIFQITKRTPKFFLKLYGELLRQVPQFTVAPSWSQPESDITPCSPEALDFLGLSRILAAPVTIK